MKKNRSKKQVYKVLWSYYDSVGINTGIVDIEAFSKTHAESVFYSINRKYVVGHDEKTKNPIFNKHGGYVCECVLTYEEWVSEGKPTKI